MWLLALVCAAILVNPPRPMPDDDTSSWTSYAWLLDRGEKPYVDIPQGKGPILFAYAWLMGRLPAEPYVSRAAASGLVIVGSLFLYVAIAARLGAWAGLAAAACVALGQVYWGVGLRTMVPQMVLMPAALMLFVLGVGSRRGWLFLAASGSLAALAALTRQMAGAETLALGVAALLLGPAGRTLALSYACGVMGAGAAAVAILWCMGVPPPTLLHALCGSETLAYAAVFSARSRYTAFLDTVLYLAPAAPLFGLGAAGWAWVWLRRSQGVAEAFWSRLLTAWLIGLAFEILATGRLYAHYFLALLPAVGVGVGILVKGLQGSDREARRSAAPLVVGALLALLAPSPLVTHRVASGWKHVILRSGYTLPEYLAARWVRSHTAPTDWLFAYTEFSHIYCFAKRPALLGITRPSAYWKDAPESVQMAERWQKWQEAMDAARPPYVVVENADRAPPVLTRLLAEGYTSIARFDSLTIYKRGKPRETMTADRER